MRFPALGLAEVVVFGALHGASNRLSRRARGVRRVAPPKSASVRTHEQDPSGVKRWNRSRVAAREAGGFSRCDGLIRDGLERRRVGRFLLEHQRESLLLPAADGDVTVALRCRGADLDAVRSGS